MIIFASWNIIQISMSELILKSVIRDPLWFRMMNTRIKAYKLKLISLLWVQPSVRMALCSGYLALMHPSAVVTDEYGVLVEQ